MNETATTFFNNNNIDVNKLEQVTESHIFSTKEVDSIAYKYGMYGNSKNELISIADIIGYDACGGNAENIFDSFDSFFDRNGDGYYKRSCGLLDIPRENIMQVLKQSFTGEPININHIHGKNNLISINGLHRYTVLRVHFLNESYMIDKDSAEYTELKEKYTIPVLVKHLDLIKTYSNYLLNKVSLFKGYVKSEYNDCWQATGNVIIELNNGEELCLNDEALIKFTRDLVLLASNNSFLETVKSDVENNSELGKYIETYIPELDVQLKGNSVIGRKYNEI